MASTQIAQGVRFMSSDMRNKLGSYMTSLEMRYGDPRVYEMQREAMRSEQAAVTFNQAKTREEALKAAYEKGRDEIRTAHATRMASARDKLQQSQSHRAGSHTQIRPS